MNTYGPRPGHEADHIRQTCTPRRLFLLQVASARPEGDDLDDDVTGLYYDSEETSLSCKMDNDIYPTCKT